MGTHRVLIVEDDPDIASFLRELLTRNGYRLSHVANGAAALAALACFNEHSYSAVLLDWHLPNYDGGQLLHLIREASRTPNLPVVVLTGSATAEDREEALRIGVTDFLQKPSTPSQILAALEKAIPEDAELAE